MTGLSNSDNVLSLLDRLGYVDYASPVWMNFKHSRENRFLESRDDFESHLVEGKHGLLYPVDDSFEKIPMTVITANIDLDDDAIPVQLLAHVRVASYHEFYHGDPSFDTVKKKSSSNNSLSSLAGLFSQEDIDRYNRFLDETTDETIDENEVTRKSLSALEFEAMFHKEKNADVYYPHIIGVAGTIFDQTVEFYSFNQAIKEQQEFMNLITESIDTEIKNGLQYVVRDSGITAKNRLKYELDDVVNRELVDLKKSEQRFFHKEYNKSTFNLKNQPRKKRFANNTEEYKAKKSINIFPVQSYGGNKPVTKVPSSWFSSDDNFLLPSTDNPLVSYCVVNSRTNFKNNTSVSPITLPIALTSTSPITGEKGLFSLGLFSHYARNKTNPSSESSSSMKFIPWMSKNVSLDMAKLVADRLQVPVTPVEYVEDKRCRKTDEYVAHSHLYTQNPSLQF